METPLFLKGSPLSTKPPISEHFFHVPPLCPIFKNKKPPPPPLILGGDYASCRISGIRSFTDFRKNDKILLKARTELPLKVNHISATIMRKSTLFDMKVYRDNVLIHLGAILLKLLVSIFGILCNQNPSLYDYAGK